MSRENGLINAEDVAREYRLSETLARDIVSGETQRALRRSPLAWIVFVAGLGLSGFLYFMPGAARDSALWVLIGCLAGWMMVGRYLAGPAIRRAAKDKAERLGHPGP